MNKIDLIAQLVSENADLKTECAMQKDMIRMMLLEIEEQEEKYKDYPSIDSTIDTNVLRKIFNIPKEEGNEPV